MIGNVIANGIGAPSDIAHNILFGLSPNPGSAPPTVPVIGGGYPITKNPFRDHRGLLNRDYRAPVAPKRIVRIRGVAQPAGVSALASVGQARARGGLGDWPAAAHPGVVRASASVGQAVACGGARAVAITRKALTHDEVFLMGFLAGQGDDE